MCAIPSLIIFGTCMIASTAVGQTTSNARAVLVTLGADGDRHGPEVTLHHQQQDIHQKEQQRHAEILPVSCGA